MRVCWAIASSGSHLAEQAGVLLQEARERYLQLPGVHRLQHRGATMAELLQVDSCDLMKLCVLRPSNCLGRHTRGMPAHKSDRLRAAASKEDPRA